MHHRAPPADRPGRKFRERLPPPPPEYRYPQFLCIGAAKAGTTWLDRNLRRHPDLHLPAIKELHYFNAVHVRRHAVWSARHRQKHGSRLFRTYIDTTDADQYDYAYLARLADIIEGRLSDHWYGRIFSLAKPEQVCGEVSPDYYRLKEPALQHIARLCPEVKIILSMRDPIGRTWSGLRMDALRLGTADASVLMDLASNPDWERRSDYPTILALWRTIFPDERLKTIVMDDIAERPFVVLEDLCAYLGVPYDENIFPKAGNPIHVGEKLDMPPELYDNLKRRLEPVYDRIVQMFPEMGRRWAALHYR
jgi:sulfotransferase family protein